MVTRKLRVITGFFGIVCVLSAADFGQIAGKCALNDLLLAERPNGANGEKSGQQDLEDDNDQPATSFSNDIDFNPVDVLSEVSKIVATNFYDQHFNHDSWARNVRDCELKIASVKTRDEFALQINALLATLNTSHTYYFAKSNPKRYQILGIFQHLAGPDFETTVIYDGIGIDTRLVGKEYYITSVFDGLAAAKAGLQFGDEILSVDGQPFHPLDSFIGKCEKTVEVNVRRGGETKSFSVPVERLDGRSMFSTALEASKQVFDRNGKKIAYVHAWSYAGQHYHESIRQTVLFGDFSQCDALVLDLRDGWGGADLNYLNLFRPPIAEIKSTPRTGPPLNFSGVWGKPVALLINGGTTSGKELFAYGFRKMRLGTIVGEKSAGAVVAGSCFLLTNGDVLYVAVSDVEVDGVRLEGVGVAPDLYVPRSLPVEPQSKNQLFDAVTSIDPQLEAAFDLLSERK
ncbi:MAG TPA: S41 family peptidase [Pirellulaceae bacterium]|nr:S41 family peptidase [Pirellulaceae bacterium]HMO91425.1 S41 family peptidase [Pirellulaceae bacterium]HMP69498.1 S41 family peptidase [Pirellulaceae bacterium]